MKWCHVRSTFREKKAEMTVSMRDMKASQKVVLPAKLATTLVEAGQIWHRQWMTKAGDNGKRSAKIGYAFATGAIKIPTSGRAYATPAHLMDGGTDNDCIA